MGSPSAQVQRLVQRHNPARSSKPSGQRDKEETAADRGGASESRELRLLATLQNGCVLSWNEEPARKLP